MNTIIYTCEVQLTDAIVQRVANGETVDLSFPQKDVFNVTNQSGFGEVDGYYTRDEVIVKLKRG